MAARRSSQHSGLKAAATHTSAPAGKVVPHLLHHGPGVLQVTCGHCGSTYLTDEDGHAEHHCFGCCSEHQEEKEQYP